MLILENHHDWQRSKNIGRDLFVWWVGRYIKHGLFTNEDIRQYRNKLKPLYGKSGWIRFENYDLALVLTDSGEDLVVENWSPKYEEDHYAMEEGEIEEGIIISPHKKIYGERLTLDKIKKEIKEVEHDKDR